MSVAVEPPMVSEIRYKRSRFSTRLPTDRRYTRSHFWLSELEDGTWRAGLTRFATRMLGDLVEHGFEVRPGDSLTVGQTIGWVEGFKAVSELYSVMSGEFLGGNPELDQDVTLLDSDPYGKGWLYQVRGEPDPESVDVNGYVTHLDGTIDQMQKSRIAGEGEGDG